MSAPWDGRPANPDADGWHWLLVAHGIGHPFPMLWAADGRMWDAGDAGWAHYEDIATRWRYLGPCLTPADHAAAAQAERAACAQLIMTRRAGWLDEGNPSEDEPVNFYFAFAAKLLIDAILARGDTSALAAAVEAGRREEREACEHGAGAVGERLGKEGGALNQTAAAGAYLAEAAIRARSGGKEPT